MSRFRITATRLALLYALFGALWVALADRVLWATVSDPHWYKILSAYANWAFIALTAVGLYLVVARELRQRQKVQDALRSSEERFRALVRHGADVIFVVDREGAIRYVSPNVEAVLGYGGTAEAPRSLLELVDPEHRTAARSMLKELASTTGVTRSFELRARHADGSDRMLEIWGKGLLDDPAVQGLILSVRDATDRKRIEAEIQRLAFFDALTGLANRRLLRDRATQAMALARRRGNAAALLYLDLDRFKTINDSLGHDAGDELLQHVAERLVHSVRDSDTLARLGGDEFAVLLSEVRGEEDAAVVARRIVHSLKQSIWIRQQPVHIGASIGIAVYPRDGANFEEVMKHADIAMYRAKAEKGGYQFYRPELSVNTRERLMLEEELHHALDNREFVLHYQPVLHPPSGDVVGAEALSRWPHERRGQVPPAEFIPLAEETGLIVQLDRLALAGAAKLSRLCADAGWDGWISVNLSSRSLADPGLIGYVAQTLESWALPPSSLVLEVTESAAMRNPDSTAELLLELKRVGVQIALDDFGMGYSSLAYLKRFPIDILKLDRDFVAGIGVDTKDESLIEGVIRLAHGLGLQVVAEGVEHQTQLNWLVAEGCDLVQGYLIGAPRPPEELLPGSAPSVRAPFAVHDLSILTPRPLRD